jgi:hypothetical protein
MRTFYRVAALLVVLLGGMALLATAGCWNVDPSLKAQVKLLHQKAAVAEASAEASPTKHPFAAANSTVKKLRAPLIVINLIAFVALAVSIGLLWTPLSIISKTAVPVCGAVSVLTLFGLIALPFFPWILLAAAIGAVALIVYEIIRFKSLPAALAAFEKEIVSFFPGHAVNLIQYPPTPAALVMATATVGSFASSLAKTAV